jgi:hypothetical protein
VTALAIQLYQRVQTAAFEIEGGVIRALYVGSVVVQAQPRRGALSNQGTTIRAPLDVADESLDRGGFACMLGGDAGHTLFIVTREWRGLESTTDTTGMGRVLSVHVPAPHAGWP